MAPSSSSLRGLISAMRWDDALSRLSSHPEESRFVNSQLGETALSAACRMKAPPPLVSALLRAHPDATAVRLVGSGRTPLHIACSDLRRESSGSVLEGDVETVGLIVVLRPETASVADDNGWLPLHCALGGGTPGLGLASPPSSLLRALIDAHPPSVVTPNRGGVTPIAMLWEGSAMNCEEGVCTLSADAARFYERAEELERRRSVQARQDPDHSRRGDFRPRQNSAAVWAKVLLFARAAYRAPRVGGVEEKGGGEELLPLHALCGIEVPASCIEFAVRIHGSEGSGGGALGTRDKGGNLPLHVAAARRLGVLELESSKGEVVDTLIRAYPKASRVTNIDGRLPLSIAVEAGAGWITGGVRSLFRAAPEVLGSRDAKTGLFPFMQAASVGSLEVSYHLLRHYPSAAAIDHSIRCP